MIFWDITDIVGCVVLIFVFQNGQEKAAADALLNVIKLKINMHIL